MPFLRITLGRPLAGEQRQRLAARLTQAIVELLGKRREVTAVLVDCVVADGWCIAGEAVEILRSTPLHAEIFITAGSNDAAQKARMLAATHALLAEEVGALPAASYVVIRELPAGDWGYGGQTQAARQAGHGR